MAELAGTLLLLAAVVGSGIMGERLAAGNEAVALMANAIATGAALVAIILAFGGISGAHLNPVVTISAAWMGGLSWREAPSYIVAQIAGAFAGVALADSMFGEAAFALSRHARSGPGQWLSEALATFGLITVIWGASRRTDASVAVAVGAYITAACWFTASTSFANPAVTMARAVTDTFAGIRPVDVPAFVAAQSAGAAGATLLFRWLLPSIETRASNIVQPHGGSR